MTVNMRLAEEKRQTIVSRCAAGVQVQCVQLFDNSAERSGV